MLPVTGYYFRRTWLHKLKIKSLSSYLLLTSPTWLGISLGVCHPVQAIQTPLTLLGGKTGGDPSGESWLFSTCLPIRSLPCSVPSAFYNGHTGLPGPLASCWAQPMGATDKTFQVDALPPHSVSPHPHCLAPRFTALPAMVMSSAGFCGEALLSWLKLSRPPGTPPAPLVLWVRASFRGALPFCVGSFTLAIPW